MIFEIIGIPLPKQSARFRKVGNFMQSYQTADVKRNEDNIRLQIIRQLPKGFEPFTGGIIITRLHYIFPMLKGLKKSELKKIESGGVVYKTTKPDLIDNLAKGLFDAMEGIVFVNDSQICAMYNVKKYYGKVPKIIIEMEEI